jgi:opacity protein-like surface antigen
LYGKVGAARLQSKFSGIVNVGDTYLPCTPGVMQYGFCLFSRQWNRTDLGLAYGAGVQLKSSSVAARFEYERIQQQSVGSPDLISFGIVWML